MKTSVKNSLKLLRGGAFIAFLLLAFLLAACGSSGSTTGASGTPTATTPPTHTPTTSTTPTGTNTPSSSTPVAQGTPANGIPFKEVRMITSTFGWALTGSEVLKTTDGGAHWINSGPLATQLKNPVADFMNMQNVWIAANIPNSANPNAIEVIRTMDGGQNWQSWSTSILTNAQYTMIGDPLHFVNTQDGWIEIVTNGGPGAGSESVAIYATTNGGQNWKQVASTDSGNSGLPREGIKSGISFADAQNGWATGSDASNKPWLYVTHNGGATWVQQPLQGENANPNAFYTTTPPVFFGSTGIMPVGVDNNGIGTNLYISKDGGQTWLPASTAPAPFAEKTVYVVDPQHAWAVDMNNLLYTTANGGQSWQKLSSSPINISQMSWINDLDGWAISSSNGTTSLLRTTNGGQTWQTL